MHLQTPEAAEALTLALQLGSTSLSHLRMSGTCLPWRLPGSIQSLQVQGEHKGMQPANSMLNDLAALLGSAFGCTVLTTLQAVVPLSAALCSWLFYVHGICGVM